MRSARASATVAILVSCVFIATALPAAAQPTEEFPGPSGAELEGYTRTDGTVVLTDGAFCSLVLGSIWEDRQLTFVDLLDKTKKQRQARAAGFEPAADDVTVSRCTEVIAAYRNDAPEDDTLVAWVRRSPVVPEAFAGLLPPDFGTDPLTQAAPVLGAARTSGFGSLVSGPFLMDAETWLVQVDAASCATWSGSLHDARDATQVIVVDDNREYLYNIVPGHYYWDVTAPDCDWAVDLASVALGPDPNATPLPRVPVPALAPDVAGQDWNAGRPNERYLTASQARSALLEAGLTAGECIEQGFETEGQGPIDAGRVWAQDPIPGTLLEVGSSVDVTAVSDCDIVRGDRVLPSE